MVHAGGSWDFTRGSQERSLWGRCYVHEDLKDMKESVMVRSGKRSLVESQVGTGVLKRPYLRLISCKKCFNIWNIRCGLNKVGRNPGTHKLGAKEHSVSGRKTYYPRHAPIRQDKDGKWALGFGTWRSLWPWPVDWWGWKSAWIGFNGKGRRMREKEYRYFIFLFYFIFYEFSYQWKQRYEVAGDRECEIKKIFFFIGKKIPCLCADGNDCSAAGR